MHVTEELLQADPQEGRPVNSKMLTYLSCGRAEEKSSEISLPPQHRQLNLEVLDGGQTPNLYTSSPITPLRDWLDSPQMVQKSKLRVKEQELKQLRREVTEERHLRHDVEFEMEKLKSRNEALRNDYKSLESKLAAQVQLSNEQKDKLDELRAKEKVWDQREMDWKKMQEKLDQYKTRAKEARWWEKTCDEVIHERDSFRLRALALEQRRNYVKDRQQVESQMADLISSLRDADDKIRNLIDERNKTAAISEALQRRNDDLERRLSCVNFDDSFPTNARVSEERHSDGGDFNSGESMRVVSDLRIAELESQLTSMSEKMVPREELLKAQTAIDDLEKHRVPKELLEMAKKVTEQLENEKEVLVNELESLKSRFNILTKECDRTVIDLSISKEEYLSLEIEAGKLNDKIVSYEATVLKLSADLEFTTAELERSVTAARDLEAQLNEKLALLNENEKACDELRTQIETLNSKTKELMKREEELKSLSDSQKLSVEEKQFEIETLNTRIKEIDSERQQGIIEIERLSKKLTDTCSLLHDVQLELTSKISFWQEKEGALQNEIVSLKNELDSVSRQLLSLIADEESVRKIATEYFLHYQTELEKLNKDHEFLTSQSVTFEPQCNTTPPKDLNLNSLLNDMKTALSSSVKMLKSAVKALNVYHDEKERCFQEHDATVSRLQSDILKLQERISPLTDERDRYQIETEALRSQLTNHVHMKNNLNNLKKENEILNSNLQAANDRLVQSEYEEEQKKHELSTLKTRMTELETQYIEVSSEVEKTKSEIQRLHVDHYEKERQGEQRLMEALKELGRVSSEKEALSVRISSLEEELDALEKNRLEIVREQKELNLAIERASSEIIDFETRISEYDSSGEFLKNRIEELERDCVGFVQDLAEKEKILSHIQTQMLERDRQLEELTSQSLTKSHEVENLGEEILRGNEKIEMLQLEVIELRDQKGRVTTEFAEAASELQSLQTLVVEYRSVIDNKEELLNSLNCQLESKDKQLQDLNLELNNGKEMLDRDHTEIKNLQSERCALSEEISELQSKFQLVISEKELLSADLKAMEDQNEVNVSKLREETEKLLKKQECISSELQTCESRLDEEVQARFKTAEEHEKLKEEFNKLSTLNQQSVVDVEKTSCELQTMREEYDNLKKEFDSVMCANVASQVEISELQKELESMRTSALKSESDREEAIKNYNDIHQHFMKVSNDISILSNEKEATIRELNLTRSDLNRVLAENENHVLEIQTLHEENERLINLQDDITRLESEVEVLGTELQSSERERLQWVAAEEEWNKKMSSIEQENIKLNHANKNLQDKLTETERSLHNSNLRLDEELSAAANKLETRERAISEERMKLRKTAEEAREMVEAYREMLNSQLEEDREEETQRKGTDSAALSTLTLELESVRQNHQHLVEVQEEEMQNARREMEAFREEARQAEESLLSLQADVKRHENTIISLKEDRSKLRGDLQNMKNEYANVLAESAALHRELEQREQVFNELTVQKEELEHTQQMNMTTINNLSERCEAIQQELRAIKTERDVYESRMREVEDCLTSEQVKTETISRQLEKSRDEVNEVLGRLSGAIREKEEATEIRENLEQRTEELVSECNEWKSFGNNKKIENERLREALESLEKDEMNLRKKCDALESSKQEASSSAREVSERYERLRSRTSELEEDYKEEIRTYRARLEMTDKRCNGLEREINDMESQLMEWRTRCQQLGNSFQEQEERLKASLDSRRVTEELLSEERQSRERYRVHCAELQTELLRVEKLSAETQTRNRQLANKVRQLEVQLEFAASDAAGTSIIISKSRSRSPTSLAAQPSPVFGNHRGELSRSYSEGGNITSLFENVDRVTPLLRTSTIDPVQSPEIDDHRQLRRRHSSPLTPSSRVFKSNQLSRFRDAKQSEILTSDSSIKSSAPVTALSALFSCEDEPMDGVEWTRIQELQKRNMQQRSHLQSSYPVETQMCKPHEITQALGSTSSLSHNYPNDSHRIPFSDLSNPYRPSRLGPNAVSEDLLRQGSENDKRQHLGIERHVSGASVSKMDPSKVDRERHTFKIPHAPSDSIARQGLNVLNSREPSDENRPPTSSDVNPQNISFEVINTPKKSHARGQFFGQRKQKYNVQTAVKSSSGEPHRQQKLDSLNRDIAIGTAVKRFSSTKASYPSTKRHSNKERQKFSNQEPVADPGSLFSGFPAERRASPVLGRRSLRDHISSSGQNTRPQPGIIDKRDTVSNSNAQNDASRYLTSKRKNRVSDSSRHNS